MKQITYDEWYKRFKLKNEVEEPDADQCMKTFNNDPRTAAAIRLLEEIARQTNSTHRL